MTLTADQKRGAEIFAVVLTGILKFVFMEWLNWRLFYIIIACGGWLLYVLIQSRRDKNTFSHWGFTRKNFSVSFLAILPVAAIVTIGMIIYAFVHDIPLLNWHLLPILLLYPIWGIIQQFLIVGLVAGNLDDMRSKIPKAVIIFATATLFAIVHYPWWLLIAATFLLALLYTFIYLKWKNLWSLGLFHGWLGAFFMFYIMNRDPWLEIFGVLLQ